MHVVKRMIMPLAHRRSAVGMIVLALVIVSFYGIASVVTV